MLRAAHISTATTWTSKDVVDFFHRSRTFQPIITSYVSKLTFVNGQLCRSAPLAVLVLQDSNSPRSPGSPNFRPVNVGAMPRSNPVNTPLAPTSIHRITP